MDGFCGLFSKALNPTYIRLRIVDGRLHQLFDPEPELVERQLVPARSISLSKLLMDHSITLKGKIFLAYVLAKSVLRYYDSDFMNAPWTTDSVHFVQEQRFDPNDDVYRRQIDPTNPFIAFSPSLSEKEVLAEHLLNRYYPHVFHRYPRILALGVMLVDLCHTGSMSATTEAMPLETQMNFDWRRCNDIIKIKNWPKWDIHNDGAAQIYKEAVQKCLNPKLFHVPSSKQGPDPAGVKRRRNALYTYVFLPLETLCTDLGILDNPDDIGCLEHLESNEEATRMPSPRFLAGKDNIM